MQIGIITSALGPAMNCGESLQRLSAFPLDVVQLTWLEKLVGQRPDNAGCRIRNLCDAYDAPPIHALALGPVAAESSEHQIRCWGDKLQQYMDIASQVGAEIVTGHPPDAIHDYPGMAATVLQRVSGYGQRQGVRCALETGNETADLTKRLLDDTPYLQICFDAANLAAAGWSREDIIGFTHDVGGRIGLVHVKGYNGTGFCTLQKDGDFGAAWQVDTVMPHYNGPFILEEGVAAAERLCSAQRGLDTLRDVCMKYAAMR